MKIFRYITLTLLPVMFLACDNFEENEYIIYPEGETAETTPITKTQDYQTVMLEDYTGWKCTNCPAAASLLSDLQSKYGEKLIAMSVHAGWFATPADANNNLDLRTAYGEKWNTEFGLSAYPIGVINRLNNGSSKGVQKDDWDNRINTLLSTTKHTLNINLGATKKDNQFIVSTQVQSLEDIDFTTLISVVVVESGIHGIQHNSDAAYGTTPEIEDYTFNHVLRSNGRIDLLLKNAMHKDETIAKNYSVNIDPSWKTENCKIVVFITNASTGEIIQSNEIEIK
ncbi:MAG: Omp28-related outer membrane protein [Bacteroidales bacterium]|nr:Omp28-related outer membrane protein [Bacteroidales bacterium]